MTRAAAAMITAALVLAGCQGGDDPKPPTASISESGSTVKPSSTEAVTSGPTPSPSPATPDPSPSGPEVSEPAWGDGAVRQEPVERPAGAPGQEITGVRIGVQEGFDRVVLDLTGEAPELGWSASFQPEAIADPSGEPLEMEGEEFLEVSVSGIDWSRESPERYDGAAVTADSTKVVTQVNFGGLFEGRQQVVIGLKSHAVYRVFALSGPARIVIDVRHP
ncbi:AMIN-like domain-containing (lipo)protein [Tessaracoccus sp.]